MTSGIRRGRFTSGRRLVLGAMALLPACVQVGSEPDVPAAIEMSALPSPSVVIGDTLRDINGVAAPIQAVVRNLAGDIIADAPVRYLYADFARDSALRVDSTSGFVTAVKALKDGAFDGRLAARVGGSLQVLRLLAVVKRPDSTDAGGVTIPLFTTTLPDTGRTGANANSAPAVTVVVRHIDSLLVSSNVRAWPVRFEIVSPANSTNDTTQAVFLVDDSGRPSVLDTTDASGSAGRRVRIRAAQFPASTAVDTVVVRATVTYKGQLLRGAPVRLALPVQKGTTSGS